RGICPRRRAVTLRMETVAKVCFMQPPPEHERLRIGLRDVPRCLLEAIAGFIGILIRQCGLASHPRVGGQWIRVDIRPDAADDRPVISRVLITEGGGRVPRYNALAHNVEKYGAIVVLASVHRTVEE